MTAVERLKLRRLNERRLARRRAMKEGFYMPSGYEEGSYRTRYGRGLDINDEDQKNANYAKQFFREREMRSRREDRLASLRERVLESRAERGARFSKRSNRDMSSFRSNLRERIYPALRERRFGR